MIRSYDLNEESMFLAVGLAIPFGIVVMFDLKRK